MVKLLVIRIKDNIMGQTCMSKQFVTEIFQNIILQCAINESNLVYSGVFME